MTFPSDINNSNDVVGYFQGNTGYEGFEDINGTFTTINDPSASPGSTFAHGVNNSGAITGYYYNGSGVYGFLDVSGHFTTLEDPSAAQLPLVPEPGVWSLIITGAGMIGAVPRRRRQLSKPRYEAYCLSR